MYYSYIYLFSLAILALVCSYLLYLHWSACGFTILAFVSLWINYSCICQTVN
jgi:hypothetical protein